MSVSALTIIDTVQGLVSLLAKMKREGRDEATDEEMDAARAGRLAEAADLDAAIREAEGDGGT